MREREMSLGRQEAFEIFKRDYLFNHLHFVSFTDHLKGEITQRHMQRAALGKSRIFLYDYKTMFNRLKGLKIEIEHLQLLMEKAKVKLQKDFEVWWSEEASNLQPLNLPFFQTEKKGNGNREHGINLFTHLNIPAYFRTPQSSSSSVPLTGDSQTDADILAFIKARQNLLQKKGKPCSIMCGSQRRLGITKTDKLQFQAHSVSERDSYRTEDDQHILNCAKVQL
uniref:Kinesin-like protein KIF6/9 C-terminal domain-containing protein n=1 Tax=Gopherus evgoodei TaxID=1825980 RepID=A0A8C4Y3A7_9SAUR